MTLFSLEGFEMIEKITKMIRVGAVLIASGLIITILAILYMFSLTMNARFQTDWGNPNFELILTYAYLLIGIVLFIVGAYFYVIGMRDMYFRPLKQLLYPQLTQRAPLKNPIRIELRTIECKSCSRNIPIDCKLCPYCGVKQIAEGTIT